MKYSLLVIIGLLYFGCKNDVRDTISAKTIIDDTISVSGGDIISSSLIAFDFRDKYYTASRDNGNFQLERSFKDSTSHSISQVRDVLSNQGFQRFVDELIVEVQDSMVPRYSASVNSVHYFSVLPYGLNDQAVNKTRLDDVSILDNTYYTIKVTFNQDGGGEDFEDEFIYWINKKTFKTDYLAYSYEENHGKGLRFREAYNERYIEGVRIVDYNNYKPENSSIGLIDLPQQFENGTLNLLSKIELKNVTIDLIDR
ncbi:DUF6503 family protein [Psychroserpens sp. MEBiC05023]